jgi:hypothetical protein
MGLNKAVRRFAVVRKGLIGATWLGLNGSRRSPLQPGHWESQPRIF